MTTPKMHCKHPFQLFIYHPKYSASLKLGTSLMLGASLFLSACAPTQTSLPVEAQTPAPVEQVKTHALDGEDKLLSSENPVPDERPDPWILVEQSHGQPAEIANPLLLSAAELFVEQQHYSTAYTMLEEIDVSLLDSEQKLTFSLIQARYALLSGDTDRAIRMTREIQKRNSMTRGNYARLLKLNIAIAAQQLNFRRAILMRLKLDPMLDESAQLDNQRKILNTLTRENTLFSPDQIRDAGTELQGWIALAELRRTQTLSEPAIMQWQLQFPQHPARIEALRTTAGARAISSQQIALLLPLTSKLGRAAQAFKAGFDAAIEKQGGNTPYQVYDIGAETELAGFYYQSAVNDGADFVVGPLGRNSTNSLLNHLESSGDSGVSTLILGELNPQTDMIPNVWGLSLSPAQDAVAIAERAIGQDLRRALVMTKDNAWGNRLSSAFVEAFQSRGGIIVDQQHFKPNEIDHTSEIKKLLNINSSEVRHARLQQLLGTNLKFSIRRRNDVDFIFLAGNTGDARNIVPLAKFYRAHDLPVYATSSVFKGKFDKLSDEDLKDLYFADLPWLLNKQIQLQAQAQAQAQAKLNSADPQSAPPVAPDAAIQTAETADPAPLLPYSSATLNRIYALGYAAFETIPQLSYLQSDSWYRFDTGTLSLNMDENRNLRHRVAWGKYDSNGISVSP